MKDAHNIVVRNVHDYISKLDDDVDPAEQTIIGELSQFWGELMTKISSDVDETLVKHLEEAEDRCLHSIQNVIADEDIRPGTRTMLQSEYSILRNSHDYMKALKDTMLKAA